VKVGKPKDAEGAKLGTTAGKRAAFKCLMSGVPVTYDHIREQGKAGRMGARLMAIVAEGDRGRVYLAPTPEMEAIALTARPEWRPETTLPVNPRDFKTPNYGLTTFADLFTPRQLVALTTFSDLVQEARERVMRDAIAADLPDDGEALAKGGAGAVAYGDAVGVYLAFAVDRVVDRHTSIATWDSSPSKLQLRNTFARQAIPMTWDFGEGNPFCMSSGTWSPSVEWVAKSLDFLPGLPSGVALQADASAQDTSLDRVVSTDPPYYDNIGYADLSDFFYVWLRRSLRTVFPSFSPRWPYPRPRNWWRRPTATAARQRPRHSSSMA
jgi:putative DNA methylase